VLADAGKKAAADLISERLNRGEQVLALDVMLQMDAGPGPSSHLFAEMLAAAGERPLGMQAAQLIAASNWLFGWAHVYQARIETSGIRTQMVAQVAVALDPNLFPEVLIRNGMPSLKHLLDEPVTYQSAPALFCLDLFKKFDVDRLAAAAVPARVVLK
jgi:hypothetical protein